MIDTAATAATAAPAQHAAYAFPNSYHGVHDGAMPAFDSLTISHSSEAARVVGQLCALCVDGGFIQTVLTGSQLELKVQEVLEERSQTMQQ
eukprot:1883-Heterococcus_DN1.PRE.1